MRWVLRDRRFRPPNRLDFSLRAPEKVRGCSKFVMLDREISTDDSFHALWLSSDTANSEQLGD